MKKIKTLAISFALSGLLAACGGGDKTSSSDNMSKELPKDEKTTSAIENDEGVVAIVNGRPVLEENFKAYAKQRKLGQHKGEKISDARMLDEFINFELALQDAENKKLQDAPDVQRELNNHRRTVMVNAAFNDYVAKNPLTEEEMRKDYDSKKAELTLTEYHLRHILLDNGDDATSVVKELEKGADFTALVKKYSTGPSASEDGLLGWQSEFDLLPEFRAPVEKLEKGQYAKTPIKTRFGWHIIYLDDKRVNPPPAYEEVKDRVRTVLQRRQVQEYFLKLRTQASIKIKEFEDSAPTIPQHQGINIESYSNN